MTPPVPMAARKRIDDLLDRARYNRGTLSHHALCATGTTGSRIAAELHLEVAQFLSGPLGGDQQVGAAIAEGRLDFVIFFWDPLEPHPHDGGSGVPSRIYTAAIGSTRRCNRRAASSNEPTGDVDHEGA